MLKKLSVIAGIIFGIIILLLVTALISFRIIFPPGKIKIIVSRQVEEYFHRKVDIGNISVDLLKGIKIDNIKVSERPDFGAGIFIQSEELSTRISIVPLIKGDIILNRIKLTKPQIKIVRFRNGEYNFSDMLSRLQINSEKPADEKRFALMGLLISNILIDRGKINYIGHTPIKVSAEIDNIELELLSLPLRRILELSSTFGINIVLGSIKFAADSILNCIFDINENKFQLTGLDIMAENGNLRLSGEIYDLEKTPSVDLNLTIDKAILSKIVKGLSPSLWLQLKFLKSKQIKLNINGPLDKIKFTLISQKSDIKLESGVGQTHSGLVRNE